ncbi:MAG: hypothetical protein JW895_09860, partial [Thermoleophilaceae bacterium]|nr:hypothetical protein [Thermoleophilaceae bacterium]
LAALLVPAPAFANTQKVKDPHGDGHSGCEIYSATAGHAKGGRLKHTITMKDRIQSKGLAPIVLVFGRRNEVGGAPRATLSSGASGVKTVLSRSKRTVTYTIKASRLRSETSIPRRQKSYFWVANGCFANPDWAPGAPGGRPKLKAHAFKR